MRLGWALGWCKNFEETPWYVGRLQNRMCKYHLICSHKESGNISNLVLKEVCLRSVIMLIFKREDKCLGKLNTLSI